MAKTIMVAVQLYVTFSISSALDAKTWTAIPSETNMPKLMALYDLWYQTRPIPPSWNNVVQCPECRDHVLISVKHITWLNEPDGNDTWNPKTHLKCPICYSLTPIDKLGKRIPPGVTTFVLDQAEKQRSKDSPAS